MAKWYSYVSGNIIKNLNFRYSVIFNFHDAKCIQFFRHMKTNKTERKFVGSSYSNANFYETDYYFSKGLRKVYPYYYTYQTFCKGRWINKTLTDVFSNEFVIPDHGVIEKRILLGKIRVNGECVPLHYKLNNQDLITSTIHRHELPVLAVPIKIIHADNEVVVVDKPPSVPVHPCGLYRHNSLLFILSKEENFKDLYLLHRLDCLTSGLVVFARNSFKANELHRQMRSRKIKKEYICKVNGYFPDGVVTCEKPIKHVRHKVSFAIVSMEGAYCATEFERISYNGMSSLLICRPLTGRTHQIRAHLHYLGYPIINDPLYNSFIYRSDNCESGGELSKVIECLKGDILKSWSLKKFENNVSKMAYGHPELFAHSNAEEFGLHDYISLPEYHHNSRNVDKSKLSVDADCEYCNSVYKDPINSCFSIFLHAFRYKGDDWEYRTELPTWAKHD